MPEELRARVLQAVASKIARASKTGIVPGGGTSHLLKLIYEKGNVSKHASPKELEANMKEGNGNSRMSSLVSTLAVLAIGYMLAKNLPDIVRYIKISRM
jgi:hypothetical protein